jgi:hypothetical protein
MGQGSDRVSSSEDPRRVEDISREIEDIRGHLGSMVAELDRRRHEALDFRLQIRRHPLAAALVAGTVALVTGGLVALALRRRRRQRSPAYRLRAMRRAFARMATEPDEFAREPDLASKMLGAAGTAAAAALARGVVERAVRVR